MIHGVFVKSLEVIQPTKRLNRIFFLLTFRVYCSDFRAYTGFRQSISFCSVNILYLICIAARFVKVLLCQTMVYVKTAFGRCIDVKIFNNHL